MLKDNGGGHYITYSIENGRPWGPSGLFSLIPSWRTQTHHFLPLSVQSSHFLQLFLILNVQSHSASPAPAFLNSSQCVTERIFKSIKPILFKRQKRVHYQCDSLEICCYRTSHFLPHILPWKTPLLPSSLNTHHCSHYWWKLVYFWACCYQQADGFEVLCSTHLVLHYLHPRPQSIISHRVET